MRELDMKTANCKVQRWLSEVANTRVHATTGSSRVCACPRKRSPVHCQSEREDVPAIGRKRLRRPMHDVSLE